MIHCFPQKIHLHIIKTFVANGKGDYFADSRHMSTDDEGY
jgi:hypothetical protein